MKEPLIVLDEKTLLKSLKKLKVAGAEQLAPSIIADLAKKPSTMRKLQKQLINESLITDDDTVRLFQTILNDTWRAWGWKGIKMVAPDSTLYSQVDKATMLAVEFCMEFDYDIVDGITRFCNHFCAIMQTRQNYFKWGVFPYYADEISQREHKAVLEREGAGFVNELKKEFTAAFGESVKQTDTYKLGVVYQMIKSLGIKISPKAYMAFMKERFAFLAEKGEIVTINHIVSKKSREAFVEHCKIVFKNK